MERIPAVELTPAASGEKIYVRLFHGRFRNLRRLVSWPLLVAYFGLVWCQWQGMPVLLFSFEDSRLYFFGSQWGWHDLPVMAGVLIMSAVGLFAVSALVGRVWCGLACPQSVWTWMFLRIEEYMEGPAWVRQRADREGLSREQWLRRAGKHLLWLALALWTAVTFTGYFVPVRDILSGITDLTLTSPAVFWIVLMTALTYLCAGLIREKICLHACPYSRFQSVMFDDNTRTVSYDNGRQSDCVKCNLCVQVCPAGIDIRDGLQAACIDCGACIDACDSVMDKLGRARGLIGYRSHNLLQGLPSPWLSRRTLAYVVVFVLVISGLCSYVISRSELSVKIHKDRQALFYEAADGSVCNSYELEAELFRNGTAVMQISVEGITTTAVYGPREISVTDKTSVTHMYQLCAERTAERSTPVYFIARTDRETVRTMTRFIAF